MNTVLYTPIYGNKLSLYGNIWIRIQFSRRDSFYQQPMVYKLHTQQAKVQPRSQGRLPLFENGYLWSTNVVLGAGG